MKVAVDTNVLVRAAVRDDARQARVAAGVLKDASLIAVALSCLCEFVWVLKRVYGFSPSKISAAIRLLIDVENVEVNRPAVEAGLAALDAGGDFADGVIASEGKRLGGETFVSFDKQTVTLLAAQGYSARLLSTSQPSRRRSSGH
jgi:predicted nucleic-acid-binding protein